MRKSLTWAVAGTAIATTALLTAAATAGATTATKAPTTLSIAAAKAAIVPGQTDVISGVLLTGTTPLAQKIVKLYRYSAEYKKWLPLEVDLTGKAGEAVFTVKPKATTEYELVFDGTSKLAASHSGIATVVVSKAPTTLSIAEAKATITAGQTDVISGVLLTGTTPLAQKIVKLYRYSATDKKWLPLEVDLTSKAGKAVFTVKPKTTTEYKLVFDGTLSLAASHSGVATVTVTK
jgi:hypothetical protein